MPEDLVKLPEYLVAPRSVKPSDFPDVGTPSSGSVTKDALTDTVSKPGECEGSLTEPMGTRSSAVAASFPVGKSTAGAGTSVSIPSTVSLETGLISPEPTGYRPASPDISKGKVNQRSN